MKLFIRVKFRAFGVTFGTVEREVSIDFLIPMIFRLFASWLPALSKLAEEFEMNGMIGRAVPRLAQPFGFYDDRGVYLEIR